jgi:putative iron-dependent peroxidase
MRPQAITQPLTQAALFLVVTVEDQGDGVRALLGNIDGLTKAVGFRYPNARLSCVIGIGSSLWDRLCPGYRPRQLHPFIPLKGVQREAVTTEGDLLFHIRAQELGICFELARLIRQQLPSGSVVVDEVQGFQYLDQRDLLGFVDGTENPGPAEVDEVAIIGDEEPDFVGGSYVIVQKYLHDLAAWEALTTEEQEMAIGRRKPDNVELSDDTKPTNSHVALTNVHGASDEELAIYRLNMPFGSLREPDYGTYFIGYARDVSITERMLANMFLGDPPGHYDRLLDFSIPVTGTLFFCPSLELIAQLGEPTCDDQSPINQA